MRLLRKNLKCKVKNVKLWCGNFLKENFHSILIGFIVSVVFSGGVTPVPIPNTEVKPTSTDDSRKAKVGDRGDNAANFFVLKIIFSGNFSVKY